MGGKTPGFYPCVTAKIIKMSENSNIARGAGVVGLATLASRILGFIREMVIAYYFGAGTATDAFFVAFQLPNTFRRLLGEGSLTVSFIPVFSHTLVQKGREAALQLANAVFTALSLILLLLTIAGVALAPLLVQLMVPGPGFTDVPGKIELTVFLTRIMFPYIFFVSLMALCMGILNSLRHFFAPAAAPVFLSISEVACVVFLYHSFEPPILALALGVMLGGIIQLGFQVPFLRKRGVHLRWKPDFRNPGLVKVGKLMVPALFGSAIYQIGILVNNFLASFLSPASVSYLNYASRIMEFPLGVFVFSIGSVILPSLSRLAATNDHAKLKETFTFAFRVAMFVIIPAMIGLIVLRVPVIQVIFQHGSFTSEATLQTAKALLYYALGLWAVAGVRVTVPVFYALHDTKTPVRVGAVTVLATMLFSVLLMHPLAHGGLALALTLASSGNLLLLLILLRRKIGLLGMWSVARSLVKVVLASLGMGVFCFLAGLQIDWLMPGNLAARILSLGGVIGGGVAVYLGLAFLLRCPELESLKDLFRRKPVPVPER